MSSKLEEDTMSKSRDRGGKKEQRTPAKSDKKKGGLPPHLQRQKEQHGSVKEIQRHLNDLEERQK
jgi:hypothetical protein